MAYITALTCPQLTSFGIMTGSIIFNSLFNALKLREKNCKNVAAESSPSISLSNYRPLLWFHSGDIRTHLRGPPSFSSQLSISVCNSVHSEIGSLAWD